MQLVYVLPTAGDSLLRTVVAPRVLEYEGGSEAYISEV